MIYYILFKSQSKRGNMLIKITGMLVLMMLAFQTMGIAQSKGFTVSGKVKFPGPGTIYIKIFSENEKSVGKRISLSPAEVKAGEVPFSFENVQAGRYAILAFLDENGNGKHDMGKFGPKEPWGNYKQVRPHFRGPQFKEMAFEVTSNMSSIEINIK
jgi:uncharacterized protein (DUF2141 family)